MNHWNLVTVPELASLIPILRLMEGLHYYRAINSTGNARIEHIKLACSYAQAIFYLETLNRQGLLPPF
jgi:hypothetical protein